MLARRRRGNIFLGIFLGFSLVLTLLGTGLGPQAASLARPANQDPGPAAGNVLTLQAPAATTPSINNQPEAVDAFAFLSPCNIQVTQGVTFTLDLMINAGTNTVTAQQSYLTFTNALLQVITPGFGC